MNPLWLPLTLFAYLSFAASGAIDKIIVGQKIKNAAVVSFYVAITGFISIWMFLLGYLPFDWAGQFRFAMPPPHLLWLALGSGVLLQLNLLAMYAALKNDEATRVVSAIGAANPIFALLFAMWLLNEQLPPVALIAFGLLVAGAVLISLNRRRVLGPSFGLAVTSAALAALQIVVSKMVYTQHHFISSFVLITIGGSLYAVALALFVPSVNREVRGLISALARKRKAKRARTKKRRGKTHPAILVFANSAFGGIGVMALNVAVPMGPASLINALRGVQYAGIFIIALLLAKRFPKLLNEELSSQTITQKFVAITLIAGGIALLTLYQP